MKHSTKTLGQMPTHLNDPDSKPKHEITPHDLDMIFKNLNKLLIKDENDDLINQAGQLHDMMKLLCRLLDLSTSQLEEKLQKEEQESRIMCYGSSMITAEKSQGYKETLKKLEQQMTDYTETIDKDWRLQYYLQYCQKLINGLEDKNIFGDLKKILTAAIDRNISELYKILKKLFSKMNDTTVIDAWDIRQITLDTQKDPKQFSQLKTLINQAHHSNNFITIYAAQEALFDLLSNAMDNKQLQNNILDTLSLFINQPKESILESCPEERTGIYRFNSKFDFQFIHDSSEINKIKKILSPESQHLEDKRMPPTTLCSSSLFKIEGKKQNEENKPAPTPPQFDFT